MGHDCVWGEQEGESWCVKDGEKRTTNECDRLWKNMWKLEKKPLICMCLCLRENNQLILILQHILYVSSLEEQAVGFITVFLKVQSVAQCQDLTFCWAVHGVVSWQLMKNSRNRARSSLKLTCTEKQTYVLRKQMIKQTDGSQNNVKTMRRNVFVYVCIHE